MRLLLVAVLACSAPQRVPSLSDDAKVAAKIDRFFAAHMTFRPQLAVDLGLHAYDGKVPDRSRAAIEAELVRLRAAQATFEAFDASRLSRARALEREVVLAEIRKELFDLETRKRPYRDPLFYLFRFSLTAYAARSYAPADVRAEAMLRACEASPRYYQQAAENLEPALPRPYLQIALLVTKGTIAYLGGDAKQTFANERVGKQLSTCLDELAKHVAAFARSLEARMPAATDDFRLGAEALVAMLHATDGIQTDIATLERVARADLDTNRAALVTAAKQIDPARDVAAVVAAVSADKPDDVVAEATAQLAQLRQFLVDKRIVSLPRPTDVIAVRPSPPHLRNNFASLGGVGPFESAPLPSFYFISPPDPAWPVEQQRAYVMSRADLLFASAHEVYPGHFVQGMHQRASGSRVLAAFETYTASEGWAHYVEQMMWEEGLGNRDPRVHVGQLKNALLRNVRFLVALGYHAGTMTVDDATKLFIEQAFADPQNARQQALRGTIDPMFLGYTLGKLLILELRADWRAANPARTLGDFHDEFLRHGEAPLPVTRRMMLGEGAPPPLSR